MASILSPTSMLSPTEPLRRPLASANRYNERLNRARSANNNFAFKLPEKASPAPRGSANKERPAREVSHREAKSAEEPVASPEVPAFKQNPFLMADRKNKQPKAAEPEGRASETNSSGKVRTPKASLVVE